MHSAKKLLSGTLVLTLASLLMQTVGVSFNVYLTAQLGEAGIGLFQLILTVYGLAVTLGCGGVRLAATRLAAEEQGCAQSMRKAVWLCVRYALCCGMAAMALLWIGSTAAAEYWLANPQAETPLRLLALSLPFVAMSAALNGYFTAVGKVGRYSAVRISEQGVKILIAAQLLRHLLPRGEQYGPVAVTGGILASEIFSFICLLLLYIMEKEKYRPNAEKFSLRRLMHIALPDVSGTGARSVLLTAEHLLIPRGLRQSGASAQSALAAYGNIHGMVFPVLLYPSAILTSLAGLLTPELAARRAAGQDRSITAVIRRVLRMTLLFAFGTAGILYTFSDGFSLVVYHTRDCAFYIRMLSPLVPVMYCDMTVDGMLKGLDEQRACMRYNIWDSGLCVALVLVLLPAFGLRGYVFILFFSELFNFYLSVRRLSRVQTVTLDMPMDLLVPLGCGILAPTAVAAVLRTGGFLWTRGTLIAAAGISVLLYCAMLYGFGAVTPADVRLSRSGIPYGRRTAAEQYAFRS